MHLPQSMEGIGESTRTRLANLYRWAQRYTPQAPDKVAGVIYEEKAQRAAELGKQKGIQWAQWVSDALKKGAGLAHKWTSQKKQSSPSPKQDT